MNKEMINRARSAFKEILDAMEKPNPPLLQNDPDIKNLVVDIVRKVEASRDPKNWPVIEYTDDFEKYHPEDHYHWTWLFFHAVFQSTELADILCILRGNGCKLVMDDTYGYRIEPIIGNHGWQNMQQYNDTKEPLNDYVQLLLPLLKQLRAAADNGDVIPKHTELQQTSLGDFE